MGSDFSFAFYNISKTFDASRKLKGAGRSICRVEAQLRKCAANFLIIGDALSGRNAIVARSDQTLHFVLSLADEQLLDATRARPNSLQFEMSVSLHDCLTVLPSLFLASRLLWRPQLGTARCRKTFPLIP